MNEMAVLDFDPLYLMCLIWRVRNSKYFDSMEWSIFRLKSIFLSSLHNWEAGEFRPIEFEYSGVC